MENDLKFVFWKNLDTKLWEWSIELLESDINIPVSTNGISATLSKAREECHAALDKINKIKRKKK